MSKDQGKARHRLSKKRIKTDAERFFGNPSPENPGRIQSAAGDFQKRQGREGYGDIGEGPEDDLEPENHHDIRSDLQDERGDDR